MSLSTTYLDILVYLSEGLTAKQISSRVYLSYKTIENYIEIMKEDAEVTNRTALVFYYRDQIEEHKNIRKAS